MKYNYKKYDIFKPKIIILLVTKTQFKKKFINLL